MVFLSICRALYDYAPQGEGELAIEEGEIVYILEKSTEDDWWKAKKKAAGEEEEEPTGLIPNNYVEEAPPIHHAKALYDYSRQTDEELSFAEDAGLLVYDTSDPDWTLVGFDGEFGFAPANYIEVIDDVEPQPEAAAATAAATAAAAAAATTTTTGTAPSASATKATTTSPPLPQRQSLKPVEQEPPPAPSSSAEATRTPAASLAGIMHNAKSSHAAGNHEPRRVQFSQEPSDGEDEQVASPPMPQRPLSDQFSPQSPISPVEAERRGSSPPGVTASPGSNRANTDFESQTIPGGYMLYHVNEVVSVLGKQKKMPTTLGVNLAKGLITIIPAKRKDGAQQEWTAEKLTHYSIEGKHVFLELVRPSKSVDFHAGAKDTAQEIVSALGELAGVSRAEGLREVLAAGSGKATRTGQMLYDFMAQGDDEVTVAVGDEVIILDDAKSDEWWMVRRVKNGKEGVVPSSYVETVGVMSPLPSTSGINAGRSPVEQNRLEEERLSREAVARSNTQNGSEVGPGYQLPHRNSSLTGGTSSTSGNAQRGKQESRSNGKSSATKTKPDASRVRTWTDRSGTFKVDAQFVGLKDGKIHLHKTNGVKIAVPVGKMATNDLEYVERETGVSLDDDKPLSDIRRKNQKHASSGRGDSASGTTIGASIAKTPEYDWFDFFLKCGVSPYQCERYSSNFTKDSMDETVLPDVTPSVLRTLGLKEGDILKVMKHLDARYGRGDSKGKSRNVSFGGEEASGNGEEGSAPGGLFSGPGGTLKNNTRKGRPAPAIATNDTIDPKAFQQKDTDDESKPPPIEKHDPNATTSPKPPPKSAGGFDDDAWNVKPTKEPSSSASHTAPANQSKSASTPSQPAKPPQPPLSGAMADLSLLSQPLQPIIAHSTGAPSQPPPPQQQFLQQAPSFQPPLQQQQQLPQQGQSFQQGQQQPQLTAQPQLIQQATGATPAFFGQLGLQPPGLQQQAPSTFSAPAQLPAINTQQTGMGPAQFQLNAGTRQRPAPPQFNQQGILMPPPPPRPLSAPQNLPIQSGFAPPPLQPQLTGVPIQGFHNPIAPSAQSLDDLNRLRLQQQYGPLPLQSQMTGMPQQGQQFAQLGGIQQQASLYQQPLLQAQTGAQQPLYLNGQQSGSPFADPRPPPLPQQRNVTGYTQQPPSNFLATQPTGSINTVLPPAVQPQLTGVNGFGRPGFGQQQQQQPPPPPVPPIPQQQSLAPLQPKITGPAPPVRFGVAEAKKLIPQPTGRKANLSQATPQNPFGF